MSPLELASFMSRPRSTVDPPHHPTLGKGRPAPSARAPARHDYRQKAAAALPRRAGLQGKAHFEAGAAAFPVSVGHGTVVGRHDAMNDGQSQARAVFLARKERLKD